MKETTQKAFLPKQANALDSFAKAWGQTAREQPWNPWAWPTLLGDRNTAKAKAKARAQAKVTPQPVTPPAPAPKPVVAEKPTKPSGFDPGGRLEGILE